MKTEQEIVLQKKMIIIFSLIILLVTMEILNIHKNTVLAASASKKEKVTTIYTNYIASEELFKIEVSGDIISGEKINPEDNISNEKIFVDDNQKSDLEVIAEELVEVAPGENIIIETPQDNSTIVEDVVEDAMPVNVVASRGSYIRETNVPPTEYEKVITVKATAYCLCKKCTGKTPSSPGYGHTASGLVIVPGTDMKVISVDPNVIPLGTEVYVDGYGYAIAADTGGAIKNNKIDVYKDTHALALQWGVRTVNVYILKNEES